MSNTMKSPKNLKKTDKDRKRAKREASMVKKNRMLHRQENLYLQYFLQEEKDMERTIEYLDRIIARR